MSPARTLASLAAFAALASGCSALPVAVGRAVAPDEAAGKPRLSKAELVSSANAICAQRALAIQELPRPQGADQTQRFFARIAGLERAEFVALANLRPPRVQERDYTRLLAQSLELARVSERFHVAVVRDDKHGRRRALADVDRVSEAYDRAAKRLGLACRQTA